MISNRRTFLRTGLAAPFFVREMLSKPPSGTLRLASFGANGMAWSTLDGIASHPKVKLVCVAEVDANRLDRVKRKYPEARIYEDWREMLHKEKKEIDAACVATPDHMHAPRGADGHTHTQEWRTYRCTLILCGFRTGNRPVLGDAYFG